MFHKQPSQQPQQLSPQQQPLNESTSQSMMIGEIHLQSDNTSVVDGKEFVGQQKLLCSECTFEKTVELSQQILELRERLGWFQHKIKELEHVATGDQAMVKELFAPMQAAIDKELESEEEAQRQMKHLEQQLASIEQQLQQQNLLSQQYQGSLKHFIQQRQQFQRQLYAKQSQYHRLASHYHQQILKKYHIIQSTLSTFQTTNFVSILYTITFENTRPFLNGQKITHQNAWKLVEIVLFYQTKYDGHYHPFYHVFWQEMKLQKDPQQHLQQPISTGNLLASINLGNLLRKQSAKEVDIDCDSQEIILSKWMPCFLLEVRHLFAFINRQGKKQEKLRYEISKQGEFQALRGKTFKGVKDKFLMIFKCLMTNLDQINKIQFFARENRVHDD